MQTVPDIDGKLRYREEKSWGSWGRVEQELGLQRFQSPGGWEERKRKGLPSRDL